MLTLRSEHLKSTKDIQEISAFLYEIDLETTHNQQTGKPEMIQPSALGELIKNMAEKIGENIEEINPPEIACMDRMEFEKWEKKEAVERMRHRAPYVFLRAAAICIGSLYAANGNTCPYMPRIWLEEVLKGKRNKIYEQRFQYLADVMERLENQSEDRAGVVLCAIIQDMMTATGYEAAADLFVLMDTFINEAERGGSKIHKTRNRQGLDILERQMADLDLSLLDK